jgi:hypothetical protein
VLDDDCTSVHHPKIHKSVLILMQSSNIYLNTPFESFSKLEEIRYYPKSVNGLMGGYKTVGD